MTADTDALRSNIRLLGDTLGLVIVEQEGEELLALEERARKLAIAGRRGSAEAMEQLVAFLGPLDLERQALVLRAFAVYFQLANIAEQHHRIRRPARRSQRGGATRSATTATSTRACSSSRSRKSAS